jgi:hypothetical protein
MNSRVIPFVAKFSTLTLFALCCSCATLTGREDPKIIPVRGIHLSAPAKKDLALATGFIRTVLPREGVNTLILEFDYNFDFQSRPEFSSKDALNRDDVRQIVSACRDAGVELIPQINCLGHQSWAKQTDRLLVKHPEFDETPGKFPDNKDIYCRSYCPLHPEVHKVLFDLIDELARACEAKSFHCGMDEIFILADPDCPRCKGKSTAGLFAGEVKMLHDQLASIGCRMWMWGDRFIDGKATGNGKWEASENGTQGAVDMVPKDIVICDWHYENSPPTPEYFAAKGFDVVACPWRKSDVALEELGRIRAIRGNPDYEIARHARGIAQTTWCGFSQFVNSFDARQNAGSASAKKTDDAAGCFIALSDALRGPQPKASGK